MEYRNPAGIAGYDLLQEIFDVSPAFMAATEGPDHVFVQVNRAYASTFPGRDLIGRRVRDALPEVAAQGFLDIVDHVYRTGERYSATETPFVFEDGTGCEERFFTFVYQALRDAEGEICGVLLHGFDVTEQVRARAQIVAKEMQYRDLIDNSHDKISVLALDGTILFESPAAERLLGWKVAELVGRNIVTLVHPDDLPRLRRQLSLIRADMTAPHLMEIRLRHRDGSWRLFEAVGKGRVTDGRTEIVTHCRDITQRRAAEEQLHLLAEMVPQLVWSTLPDGRHDYYNQRWYEYTGMPESDNDGWTWASYLHEDDVDRSVARWRESLRTGEPYEIEYRFRRASDGAYRWFIGRAVPQKDSNGRIVRWFGTCTDVHDERTALDAARVMDARFAAVARATNDVIWDWDLGTNTVWRNDNAISVLLLEHDGLLDVEGWTRRIHPDDRERVHASVYAAINEGRDTWTEEYRFIRGDGSIAFILDRGLLIRDDDGVPRRMTGSMLDMTGRIRLEEELRQAQKLEAIGRLAGGVAHDFNNLLTVITSCTEIIFTDIASDHPLHGDIMEIRRAADRAAALTRQLLAFSRRQVLQPRDICISDVVLDLKRMLGRIIGENIELCAETTRDAVVRADPGQLEQIIMNLVVNSRDAMAQGGVLTLRTRPVDVSGVEAAALDVAPGSFICLSVSDTGEGMSAEVRARAMEPFFTTKPVGRGTGLGLSTVHGIVKQSGGALDIVSEPGRGTTVNVLLPASDVRAVRPSPPTPHTARTRSGNGTILLVEDDDSVRAITRRTLVRSGYGVMEACNGVDALRIVDAHCADIDLILTDLMMPGMSGRQFAAAVRERCSTPLLYMSGYAEEDVLPRDEIDEGVRLLEKPFTVEQLIHAVTDMMLPAA